MLSYTLKTIFDFQKLSSYLSLRKKPIHICVHGCACVCKTNRAFLALITDSPLAERPSSIAALWGKGC